MGRAARQRMKVLSYRYLKIIGTVDYSTSLQYSTVVFTVDVVLLVVNKMIEHKTDKLWKRTHRKNELVLFRPEMKGTTDEKFPLTCIISQNITQWAFHVLDLNPL